MPSAKVTTSVTDLSTRVTSSGSYNAAIVIAAKKGPINTPTLINSQTALLNTFTPDGTIEIGWDQAYYEAYRFLATQSGLYVVRAANTSSTPALYGGCKIRMYNSTLDHASLTNGFQDSDEAPLDYDDDAMIIYGSSQGAFNNNVSVAIITDPSVVKLEGCFIVRVFYKNTKVEEFTCSLNPSMKNGYGVNCYAETALVASNYIRAVVNDDEEVLKTSSYSLDVVGTVTFSNDVITAKNTVRRNHEYAEGELIVVSDITNNTAYYACTTAGRTSDTAPSFVSSSKYLITVEDGDCVWTLQEQVKTYVADTDYDAGDIISVVSGSYTMNFRALVSGTTSTKTPTWLDDNGEPLYTVEDGTIVWSNLDQTIEVSEISAYTGVAGNKGAKLNLSKYAIYSDYYFAKEITLDETVTIEDPTSIKNEYVEKEVSYTATYTGDASEDHYILPKQSDKVEGAYVATPLAGGSDGADVTDGDRITALKTLSKQDDVDVQLIMDGGNTTTAYANAIVDICEARDQSTHGIISVPYENCMGLISGDALQDILDYRNNTLNANTHLISLYATHQLIYDEFNDRNIYVSPSCFVTARKLAVAQENGWYWATAGLNRGVINSLDVANSFDSTSLDELADAQVNMIIKRSGTGIVIWDEVNQLSTACDMQNEHIADYIDLYLRPNLKTALEAYLFEFNDEQTRDLIWSMVNSFMVSQGRAVYEYQVVCDATNNTDNDIENNILNCWLFIKPTQISKEIKQEIIVSPQSVEFSDLSW